MDTTSWEYLMSRTQDQNLLNLYRKLKESGVSATAAQRKGAYNVGEGYEFNPLTGTLSKGTDYGYSSLSNTTNYGGQNFKGFFDPDVLNQIGEDDWTTSINKYSDDLKSREDSANSYLEREYLKKLEQFGGLWNDSVSIDDNKFLQDIGADPMFKDIYQQNNQNILEGAYLSAYNRLNPNTQMQHKSSLGGPTGAVAYLTNTDWTDFYTGGKEVQDKRANETAYQNELNAIYSNPSKQGYLRNKAIDEVNKKYGKLTQTDWDKKYTNIRPQVGTQAQPIASRASSSTSIYPTPAPTQPSSPIQPSTPSAQPTNNEETDWKSLYESLKKQMEYKPETSYTYAPTASYSPKSYSYRGTTSYSGKGA